MSEAQTLRVCHTETVMAAVARLRRTDQNRAVAAVIGLQTYVDINEYQSGIPDEVFALIEPEYAELLPLFVHKRP